MRRSLPITGQPASRHEKADHKIEAILHVTDLYVGPTLCFNSKRYFLDGKIILQMRKEVVHANRGGAVAAIARFERVAGTLGLRGLGLFLLSVG